MRSWMSSNAMLAETSCLCSLEGACNTNVYGRGKCQGRPGAAQCPPANWQCWHLLVLHLNT